jgi:hypothetical protein
LVKIGKPRVEVGGPWAGVGEPWREVGELWKEIGGRWKNSRGRELYLNKISCTFADRFIVSRCRRAKTGSRKEKMALFSGNINRLIK